MAIKFSIEPIELLIMADVDIARSSGSYYTAKRCPVCNGGDHGDSFTFIVHKIDGNYKCTRQKCGASGNFWRLLETLNLNPRDYVEEYTKF